MFFVDNHYFQALTINALCMKGKAMKSNVIIKTFSGLFI